MRPTPLTIVRRSSIAAVLAFSTAGCLFDDTAADRTVTVSQLQSTGQTGAFAVDTSQLPPGVESEKGSSLICM